MAHLEDLAPGSVVRGAFSNSPVTVLTTKWIGTVAVELVYKEPSMENG